MRNYDKLNIILKKLITKEPEIKVKVILLIGVFELKYSKKPNFAVTNEIVNLSYKIISKINVKNFVNAVLRNYLRNADNTEIELQKNQEYTLNFPSWMIKQLKIEYPNDYIKIIKNLNLKPKLGLRVNNKITTIEKYQNLLIQNNFF